MKCNKKYNDEGILKKPSKKKKRKNVAPQNPRFLPSAQMQGEGVLEKEEEKKPKPNTVNRNSLMLRLKQKVSKRRNRSKGRNTSESCLKPNC